MNALPTIMAHSLSERLEDKKWLIDQLWTNEGVGIIGGEPKCCKSFLALNMAIAVSSGIACLSKYQVQEKGSVVLYAAEDAPHIVKGRLEGLCRPLGIPLFQGRLQF
jgi:RecA-family ATPase